MKQNHLLVLAAVLLLGGFGTAAWLYDRQQGAERTALAEANTDALVREHSPRAGDPAAKVTIVEFFDPACETCRAFHPLVKELLAAYPGQVNLVLRYAAFHRGSDYVVRLLEAARLQGKYWETLEATLDAQPAWASHHDPKPERLWMRLGQTGLDFERVRADMERPEIHRILEQDAADLRTLQVTKTPTFFVNGKPLPRFGAEELRNLVAAEVRANY